MVIVPAVLLIAAAVAGLIPGAVPGVERAAARFADHSAYAAWVLHGTTISWPKVSPGPIQTIDVLFALLALAGAVGSAALGLFGRPLRESLPSGIREPARNGLRGLRHLHSGHIGDYIAWWTAGASVLGGVCLIVLA